MKLKLGIIVDSKRVNKEDYDLLNWIENQKNIDLSLLIIQNLDFSITRARIKYGGIKVFLRKILFRFLLKKFLCKDRIFTIENIYIFNTKLKLKN